MAITKNLNTVDRSLRGVIGVLFFGFAFLNGELIEEPILEVLIGIFGGLNLISLFTGWCPVYHIAGISTRADS